MAAQRKSPRRRPHRKRAASSLAARAYELVKNDILTCVLEPGQQIAQPQLASRYQVGITPMREALQRLVREGMLQALPRFGYLVREVTVADVAELYEARLIVETATARLATERASTAQLEHITELAGFTYRHKDRASYNEFLAHNAAFHRAVATASGNRRLAEWLSQAFDELTRVFHMELDVRDCAEEMRAEHTALARALAQRDADEAERIVRAQIASSKARVVDSLVPRAGGGGILRPTAQVNRS
jgi:DNA-binding GntR family transcriptional regulator